MTFKVLFGSAVQVASCSSTVSPILAQNVALKASETHLSTFEVYVQSAAASNLSCLVSLLDSQARPLSGCLTVWATTMTMTRQIQVAVAEVQTPSKWHAYTGISF